MKTACHRSYKDLFISILWYRYTLELSSSTHPVFYSYVELDRSAYSLFLKIKINIPKYGLGQCEICQQFFSYRRKMLVHQRSHTGVRPYKCEVCGRDFAQSSNLSEHLRSHTDEKPYSCDMCERVYKRRTHLTRHKRSHERTLEVLAGNAA